MAPPFGMAGRLNRNRASQRRYVPPRYCAFSKGSTSPSLCGARRLRRAIPPSFVPRPRGFHPIRGASAPLGWSSRGGSQEGGNHRKSPMGSPTGQRPVGERRSKGANVVFAAGGNGVEWTLRRRGDLSIPFPHWERDAPGRGVPAIVPRPRAGNSRPRDLPLDNRSPI